MKSSALKPSPPQHALDLVIEFEGVVMAEQFGEPIELRGELLVLRFVGAGGEFLGDALELLLRGEEFVERGLGFVEERAARREFRDPAAACRAGHRRGA